MICQGPHQFDSVKGCEHEADDCDVAVNADNAVKCLQAGTAHWQIEKNQFKFVSVFYRSVLLNTSGVWVINKDSFFFVGTTLLTSSLEGVDSAQVLFSMTLLDEHFS